MTAARLLYERQDKSIVASLGLPLWVVGQTELLSLSMPELPVIEVLPYAFMGSELWLLVVGVALVMRAMGQTIAAAALHSPKSRDDCRLRCGGARYLRTLLRRSQRPSCGPSYANAGCVARSGSRRGEPSERAAAHSFFSVRYHLACTSMSSIHSMFCW